MAEHGQREALRLEDASWARSTVRSSPAGLKDLGYGIEKTHADGRFEFAGVPRAAIEAFSSRRAEIEAAMEERGLGASGDNPGSPSARR